MAKPMSERAAWIFLAKAWEGADRDEFGDFRTSKGRRCLCAAIMDLINSKSLEKKAGVSMICRIDQLYPGGGFAWPTSTAAGKRSRIAFCRRQAKALERKKAKV